MADEARITLDQVKEYFEERGLDTPTAINFQPRFRNDVYVVQGEVISKVDPNYCLTIPSAEELMLILEDLKPTGFLASPLSIEALDNVPWFEFESGATRNAGQLAQYWNGNAGDPGGKAAEQRARQDIAWG